MLNELEIISSPITNYSNIFGAQYSIIPPLLSGTSLFFLRTKQRERIQSPYGDGFRY